MNRGARYYFLPTYDKGNFVIKVRAFICWPRYLTAPLTPFSRQVTGPDGWSFTPSEVPVNTAAEDSPCTSNLIAPTAG